MAKPPVDAAEGDASEIFRPVEAGGAFEKTVEQVLGAIKSGAVPCGERLPPERELALHLKVSRVTLREAIRALAEAGYVEARRGRRGGTFVVYQPSRPRASSLDRSHLARLEDLLAFRQVVEVGAATLAASRNLGRSERDLLDRTCEEARDTPFEEYREADTRLHLLIAELSGSSMLTRAVTDVRLRTNDLLDALPTRQQPLLHSNLQHSEIVAAILKRDRRAADAAMKGHLEATAALLRGFLS